MSKERICPDCDGHGSRYNDFTHLEEGCTRCNGEGVIGYKEHNASFGNEKLTREKLNRE